MLVFFLMSVVVWGTHVRKFQNNEASSLLECLFSSGFLFHLCPTSTLNIFVFSSSVCPKCAADTDTSYATFFLQYSCRLFIVRACLLPNI